MAQIEPEYYDLLTEWHKLNRNSGTIQTEIVAQIDRNSGTNRTEISILDSQIYPSNIFKEFYFLRWGIETFNDELKNKLIVEYFTGYSKMSIEQDFFCAVFISNLQSIIVNDLEEELKVKNQNTKLDYKINTNLSYGFLKNRILELLFKEAPLEEVFKDLENLFLQNTIPIRLNRSNKREAGKYRTRVRFLVLKNQKDAI